MFLKQEVRHIPDQRTPATVVARVRLTNVRPLSNVCFMKEAEPLRACQGIGLTPHVSGAEARGTR